MTLSPPSSFSLPSWTKMDSTKEAGAFMFNENGILFPSAAMDTDVFAGMKKYGVDNIEMVQLNLKKSKKPFSIYCDGEGAINRKHMNNTAFGRLVHGPLFFVGANEKTGNDVATTWSKVSAAISETHHVCGWPLTREEKGKKSVSVASIAKDLLARIVPPSVVEAVWTSNVKYCQTTLLDGEPLAIDEVCVKGSHVRCGSIVERQTIPDPRQAYPGPLIETIALTLLTVEGSKQRPMVIAHFLQDGTLVRAQVNCFAMGIMADDGYYIAEYADEVEDARLEENREWKEENETKPNLVLSIGDTDDESGDSASEDKEHEENKDQESGAAEEDEKQKTGIDSEQGEEQDGPPTKKARCSVDSPTAD